MPSNTDSAPQRPRRALKTRLLLGFLKLVGVAVALYLALPWFGFRLTRAARSPQALVGSEIERSNAAPDRLASQPGKPANLIVFVADGLGFAHLSAARAASRDASGRTVWDRFTATGWHEPRSATGFLVDSAASATALATGVPTHYGRVGVGIDNAALPNLFERAGDLGYRGGIVTDSYIWDATPAAFAVHSPGGRDDAETILRQLAHAPIELLIGELEDLGEGDVPAWEPTRAILEEEFRVFGPEPVETAAFLDQGSRSGRTVAVFAEDQVTDLESTPNLPQLVEVALERLASDARPFLLLVESEEADSASHRSDFKRLLRGLRAIEATLEVVFGFAERDGETLVVFTSDHETGGLALALADETNKSFKALWPTRDHSGVAVPVLARGPGAENFSGIRSTWEIGRMLGEMLRAPTHAAESTSDESG